MKRQITCSEAVQRLEMMFRALNAKYFYGELEEPVITVQSTPKFYGHATNGKIWNVADEERYELNIGAESLNRPIEQVAATVVHEMVHLYCTANDIQDTSRGGTYHNKRFKTEAEKRGLHIEKAAKIGYSETTPTPELCEFVKERGWERINLARNTTAEKGKGKSSSTRKYTCPCCGQSVRATKAVNIICGDCMQTMETDED